MIFDPLPEDLTQLVTPRAIKNYATSLGWLPVPNVNGAIAVYHHPKEILRQLVVPLDETYDDYGGSVAEAVRKLAEFEDRPALEVLNHLLLPPADVLRFKESGPDTETGTAPLDQVISLLEGTKKMLLSMAHSVLTPRRYHPRLSRTEADQFLESCRMGQTERGSFVVTIACPHDFLQGTSGQGESYSRQITQGLLESLSAIDDATDNNTVDDLSDEAKFPLISANFLESLLMLRPEAERASLQVSASWSRALSPPSAGKAKSVLVLRQDCFEAVEYLAPKLRAIPEPRQTSLVGFVDQLRGQQGRDGRMAGEVVVLFIQESGESLRARLDLSADDYQAAGKAHLENNPVFFRGILVRGPRNNRVTDVTGFKIIPEEFSRLPPR